MKRIQTRNAMATVIALWAVGIVAGCDTATDTDVTNDLATRTQEVNLDDPYGGFSTADESPAFGDPAFAADFGPAGDVLVTDDVDTTRTDRRHPRRFLMITWGNLRADSLIDFPTDWTGSLCVENGVPVVRRLIRFDARDHLMPRTTRACVEWVSHTQPSFDGMVVALHKTFSCDSLGEVAAMDTLCNEPMSVTFKTGPLTVTFSQEQLADLHRVIPVDDAGNAVAFNTVTVMPGDCPNGFLAGQWKPAGERRGGAFRGKWVSENGAHAGYVRGVYGINAREERVFFGKWITEGGRFQGLMKGHYGALPATRTGLADGWFEGIWLSRELRVMGGLHGVWGTGDEAGEGGFFRGRWATRCR